LGVLNTYRPPGQTRWSKALVRHGADARAALAAVLGVAAKDIRVRDRPEQAKSWRLLIPRQTRGAVLCYAAENHAFMDRH
jgi:hypothetical protein